MSSKAGYAVAGLFVGAAVDLLINLLAAAIQQQAFADQFSASSVWVLAALSVIGLLVGYWLGVELRLPSPTASEPTPPGKSETVTITRLRALLSYAKLRGRGIHLSDILLVGSRLDIKTKD